MSGNFPPCPTRESASQMVDTSETSLQARLSSGRFVMTAEVVPPVSCDPHDLLHKAAPLKGLVDAVNVTEVAGAVPFLSGAADMPIDPKPDWQPIGLKGKIDAGARFAQTQFCMDAGVLRRYLARLTEAGILPGLAMLIGVNPLRSAKSAQWM